MSEMLKIKVYNIMTLGKLNCDKWIESKVMKKKNKAICLVSRLIDKILWL